MLLTVEEMVSNLRDVVNIANKEEGVEDGAVNTMTDEDLLLYIKLGVTRAFPDVTDIEDLPNGSEYALMLLAQISLFTKLAVLEVDSIDLVADNNNQLRQSQRFDHYMKLVASAQEQYDSWLDNEGNGSIQCFNLFINRREQSRRNYELTPTPKISLKINGVTNESAEISWSVLSVRNFGHYKVFLSENPIVDLFREGDKAENKVSDGAVLVKSTSNIKNNHYRATGLKPETTYYVAVFVVERNLVFGYSEKSFTTLEEYVEEEEFELGGEDNG